MNKKQIRDAIAKALEQKGDRKFIQSVEFIVNFRGIDFSKPENRLNLDIVLPKGKGGKEEKICVIADEPVTNAAKKAGAELTISPADLPKYANKENLKMLAREYKLLAQPNLMAQVAKNLGQYLGPRGKLPKPIVGNVADLIDKTRRGVRLGSKGRYLPVAQAFIGTERMSVDDLTENADAIYEAVKTKVGEPSIRSAYIKTTMGKAVRIV